MNYSTAHGYHCALPSKRGHTPIQETARSGTPVAAVQPSRKSGRERRHTPLRGVAPFRGLAPFGGSTLYFHCSILIESDLPTHPYFSGDTRILRISPAHPRYFVRSPAKNIDLRVAWVQRSHVLYAMELGESSLSSVCGSAVSGESSRSDDDTDTEPSTKKQKLTSGTRKFSGSAKYSTTYQSEWESKYDFVTRSGSKGHFYCKVCRKDVSIKHQGALDIERHSEGKIHRQRIVSARSQTRLSFKSTAHPMHEQVTAAEVRNTVMLAHHNAALCLADHIGPMQCTNFPDSRTITAHERKQHAF